MSSTAHPVVVGVTEGPESVAALRYAIQAARLRRTALVVAHGVRLPYTEPALAGDIGESMREAGEQVIRDAMAEVVVPPQLDVQTVVELTPPLSLLAALSADADHLVLGQHHLTLLERLTEGSLAGPLAARASCPIVVVPPYHRQRGPHAEDEVVVALDATSAAEAALQFGFEEAALRQATLVAMHASPPDLSGADAQRESEAERRTLAEMLAGWKADFPEVDVRTVVLSGEPQELIVQASRNAGLMIVGRPHGSLIGRWSRSVAHAVLKRTRCPIAVVPPSTALRSRVSRLVATQRGHR